MFIKDILIILIAAGIGRIISRKLAQPVILGEILMGMLIGNLGIVNLTGILTDLADIGVLILLFSAGFSMSLVRIKRLGKASVTVAIMGVVTPFALGFFSSSFFGFSLMPSLFVGGTLVATSVGLQTAILKDLRMLRSEIGALIIGSAVADDVLGIIILAVLGGIAVATTTLLMNLSWIVLGAIALFGLSLTVGVKLARKLSTMLHLREDDLLLLALIVIFAFGFFAKGVGLETIVGSFLAGLILSESLFAREIIEEIVSFGEAFFVPIFFVGMGLRFDVHAFASIGIFAVVILAVAIISKIIGCGLGAKMTNFSWKGSLAAGVAMIPRAEVALIIARTGHESGVIGSEIVSLVLILVIVTTLVTPPLLKKALVGVEE